MGGPAVIDLLLDTHVWIWHLLGSERLPRSFRDAIESDENECWLSPVSIWELSLLNARDRISLDPGFQEWVRQALQKFPVRDAPLTREVGLATERLELPHRDPADHFIAATAVVYNLTLATVDRRLVGATGLNTCPTGGGS